MTFVCAIAAFCVETSYAQLPDYTGRPVTELIEALRESGARIVYNEALIPADLRVSVVPTAADPFEGLREILAPLGLDAERGPGDTWLIVSGEGGDEGEATVDRSLPRPLTRPSIETVIVTASRYPIERQSPITANSLGRHTLETTPALGQDPIRVTHRLPGVSSNKLTSRVHVRGGDLDEVLLTLDGVRLYSPYHLKDFQNVFSSINPRIIDSMDVRTGGYEARFGDQMSGVIEMRSIVPAQPRHHELAISLLDASVLSSGTFSDGNASWVTTLRRGNLDVLANSGDSGIGTPQYVDFFNKLTFAPSESLVVETGVLSLDDKISLQDKDEATATADYGDTYYWVRVGQNNSEGFDGTYVVSSTKLNRVRIGSIEATDRAIGSLSERRKFERSALSAEWSLRLADTRWINWGLEVADLALGHDFRSSRSDLLPIVAPMLNGLNAPPDDARIRLDQTKRFYFLSFRFQPINRLTTELGVRRDEQSLSNGGQTSPRVNLRLDVGPRTSLRAAWGEFAQSDSLSELAVADGDTALQPAEESHHLILGLEHLFGASGRLRAEVYEKKITRLKPRYENLLEKVSLLPELLPDRFMIAPLDAKSTGVEVSIEGGSERIAWWTNLAVAKTRERLPTGTFAPAWDERQAFKAGGEWSGAKWEFSISMTYRSGWPISRIRAAGGGLLIESYNGARLADFSSLDVRANRNVEVEHGVLNWFIEISNLADHRNYCCVDYEFVDTGGGTSELSTELDQLLGRVPNVGIRWQL